MHWFRRRLATNPAVAGYCVRGALRSILLSVACLCAIAAQGSNAFAQARHALLIGNQGYTAKIGPLKNPHDDIALVGAALRTLGFVVDEIKDADYRSIDGAIKRHVATVRRGGQGTISFVYYSGHGAANPETKINYMIPVDASAVDEELWTYSLNLNTIVQSLRTEAPLATHYVVFDACRSELNLGAGTKSLAEKGLVPFAYMPGMLIAFSTAPGQTASDGKEKGGGPYAKALAEEIVKPGVDSMLVFSRVARRVQRQIGQDPYLSASTMPEIFLAGRPDAASASSNSSSAPEISRVSEAELAWRWVKNTSSRTTLEDFIKQFGTSEYAPLAQARLKQLEAAKIEQAALPSSEPVSKPAVQPGGPVDNQAANLSVVHIAPSHQEAITAHAVSANRRLFATGSMDWTVQILDADTGAILHVLKGHKGPVGDVAFTPDSRRLVTIGRDGTGILWDAESGKQIKRLDGNVGTFQRVFAPPRGGLMVTAGSKGVMLWDAEFLQPPVTLPGMDPKFSNGGSFLLTNTGNGVAVHRPASGELIATLKGGLVYYRLEFSPDDRYLVALANPNLVNVWDTETWKLSYSREVEPARDTGATVISPDGSLFVLTGPGDVYDLKTGQDLARLKGASAYGQFSSDSSYYLSLIPNKEIAVWSVADFRQSSLPEKAGSMQSCSFVGLSNGFGSFFIGDPLFKSDGDQVFAACREGIFRWSLASKKLIATYKLNLRYRMPAVVGADISLRYVPSLDRFMLASTWDRFLIEAK
jgi:WD40 repeat protein